MNVRNAPTGGLTAVFSLLLLALLAGCATRPAPDIRGRWRPVNYFADAPQELPLQPAHAYHAAPSDRTLKALLDRWAKDAGMRLDYQHPSDFTLHAPVMQMRSGDVRDATSRLAALYAAQQVAISVEDARIVVRRAASAGAGPSAAMGGSQP